MSLRDGYVKLVEYRRLDSRIAMTVYDMLSKARYSMEAPCAGFNPINPPSLPSPDDVEAVRSARMYARRVKLYLEVLERCSKLYEDLLRLGVEAWDSFYLFHLADIASTRLSGIVALNVEPDESVFNVISLDLKEVELSIYNIVSSAKWILNPLMVAYEHSPLYRIVVDMLRSEGYDIKGILDKLASVETPRLSNEILEWIRREGSLLPVILGSLVRRKLVLKAFKARENPEMVGGRLASRFKRLLKPQTLARLVEIIASGKPSTTKDLILCSIAKEVADSSSLYLHLLASLKPLNYIKTLWRPPKCPYPGFKWPLEHVLREHVTHGIIDDRLAEAIKNNLRLILKTDIPDSVASRYAIAVKTAMMNLLKQA